MLDRQRIIIDIVLRAPQTPSLTQLMSWLFLLREESGFGQRQRAYYDFVPMADGPFSFVAKREISALEQTGLFAMDSLRVLRESTDDARRAAGTLDAASREGIADVLARYASTSHADLKARVSERFPDWIRTTGAGTTTRGETAVYTVGYEGRSVDALIHGLLRNAIRRVVDVRKNALSRKYGFAARTLRTLCDAVGIEYIHLPDLGIASALRRDVESPTAYRKLFDDYEHTTLRHNATVVQHAASLVREAPTALMCFEADACACHRGRLAPRVAEIAELSVHHL